MFASLTHGDGCCNYVALNQVQINCLVEASKIIDDLSNTNLAYLGFDYFGKG